MESLNMNRSEEGIDNQQQIVSDIRRYILDAVKHTSINKSLSGISVTVETIVDENDNHIIIVGRTHEKSNTIQAWIITIETTDVKNNNFSISSVSVSADKKSEYLQARSLMDGKSVVVDSADVTSLSALRASLSQVLDPPLIVPGG